MKTYNDVTNFIGEKITALSLAEQIQFLQNLMYQFVNNLPDDWLDNELDSEKPHYQAIFQQIFEQTWQSDIIESELSALDDIMWAMGENYPHSTSDEILLVMELLDYWLVLQDFEQKSPESDTVTLSATISYLSYFDELVENDTGETADIDNWLTYPQTAYGFEMVKSALAKH